MVIKAQNNVTKDDIKALVNCNSSKLKFMLILLIVTFSAFFIFALVMGNKLSNLNVYILGIIWCAAVYCYAFFLHPKLAYSSYKRKYTENAVIKFQFNAEYVEIAVESEKNNYKECKEYKDMFRIYETPEYFFFYIKSSKSFIMKKSGLTEGTAEDISDMITNENPRIFIRKVK